MALVRWIKGVSLKGNSRVNTDEFRVDPGTTLLASST